MALSALSETTAQNSAHEKLEKETKRITLSIVPVAEQEPRRLFRIRYVMGGLLVASAFIAIFTNVGISQNQYELVSLNAQLNELNQTNNGLKEQTRYLESPQVLNKKALDLGMVEPGIPGVINISAGTATHGALSTGEKPESGLLDLPTKPAKALSVKNVTPVVPVVAPVEIPAVEKTTQEVVPAPIATKAETVDSVPGVRPVFDEALLNGGTIPAPSLRTPQG